MHGLFGLYMGPDLYLASQMPPPIQELRVASDGWVAWTAEERCQGISGVLKRMAEGLFVAYGDRLSSARPLPSAGGLNSALAWCRSSMTRFSGALCSADKLFLFTDHSASVPLLYVVNPDGSVSFSSEAKVLLSADPHLHALSRDIGLRDHPRQGQTIFPGVSAVPAGTILTFDRKEASWLVAGVRRYFALRRNPTITNLQRGISRLAKALDESVSQAVQGLSEVGLTLSGGIDSSSIGVLARPKVQTLRCYTVGTTYKDEFAAARYVADHLGATHYKFLLRPRDVAELLPEMIMRMETFDPLTLKIAAPLFFLFRCVAKHDLSTILLTGYGADLLFAGALSPSLPERLIESTVFSQVVATASSNEMTPRLSSGLGLTVRYPFWSPEMLKTALSIHGRLKTDGENVKYILRRTMENVLPTRVAWRPKLGIHDGAAVDRLFAEVLGEANPAKQRSTLKRLARDLFFGDEQSFTAAEAQGAGSARAVGLAT